MNESNDRVQIEGRTKLRGTAIHRILTDGGEDLVFVVGQGNGGKRECYHTDPDCFLLGKARSVIEKPRSVLDPNLTLCPSCAGELTPYRGDGNRSLSKLLESTRPEDVGLSPLRNDQERSVATDGGSIDLGDLDDASILEFHGEAVLALTGTNGSIRVTVPEAEIEPLQDTVNELEEFYSGSHDPGDSHAQRIAEQLRMADRDGGDRNA